MTDEGLTAEDARAHAARSEELARRTQNIAAEMAAAGMESKAEYYRLAAQNMNAAAARLLAAAERYEREEDEDKEDASNALAVLYERADLNRQSHGDRFEAANVWSYLNGDERAEFARLYERAYGLPVSWEWT